MGISDLRHSISNIEQTGESVICVMRLLPSNLLGISDLRHFVDQLSASFEVFDGILLMNFKVLMFCPTWLKTLLRSLRLPSLSPYDCFIIRSSFQPIVHMLFHLESGRTS